MSAQSRFLRHRRLSPDLRISFISFVPSAELRSGREVYAWIFSQPCRPLEAAPDRCACGRSDLAKLVSTKSIVGAMSEGTGIKGAAKAVVDYYRSMFNSFDADQCAHPPPSPLRYD